MLGQGGPDALEQLPGWDDDAREGLDRIVRDCLAPSACLRPAAATVTRRLLLASSFGGTYVDEFEEELRFGIQAGQSLFAVVTDDLDALEAVIVANNAAAMAFDVDLARWFTGMPFPGPKPAELFKRLLAWPRAEGRDLPDIEPGTAARLAKEFFPASMRDIEMALRMCALKHGRVDERVLDKSVRVVRTNGRTAYSVSAAKRWTALRWTGRAFAEDLADHVALSGSGKLWTVTGKEIRSEVPVVRARRGTLDRAAVVAMTCQAPVGSLVLTPGKQVVVQLAARNQIVLQEDALAQLVPARQAVGARLASLDFAGYTLDWRWVPGAG